MISRIKFLLEAIGARLWELEEGNYEFFIELKWDVLTIIAMVAGVLAIVSWTNLGVPFLVIVGVVFGVVVLMMSLFGFRLWEQVKFEFGDRRSNVVEGGYEATPEQRH